MRAKKKLGQHWLTDKPSLAKVIDAANIVITDTVLEIGPGLGNLTDLLTQKANNIVAVEKDHELYEILKDKYADINKINLIYADILKFDFSIIKSNYKIVANIPYYITSNLIRIISESNNRPSLAVLLVQKEVAERISAIPGQMSLLSVTSQLYWTVELKQTIKASCFTPPPKVDSKIILLRQKNKNSEYNQKIIQLASYGFAQRRKKLVNNLSIKLDLNKDKVIKIFISVGLNKDIRAQDLSIDQWQKLSDKIIT